MRGPQARGPWRRPHHARHSLARRGRLRQRAAFPGSAPALACGVHELLAMIPARSARALSVSLLVGLFAASASADSAAVAGAPGEASKAVSSHPIPDDRTVDRNADRPPKAPAPQGPSERGLAISTGLPLRFLNEEGALSLSYGFAGHFAVRANVASYRAHGAPLCFECEVSYHGYERDLGAGLVWYPRRLWSGPTFELGAFVRDRDVQTYDDFAEYDRVRVATDSTVVAGRALVGWSWHWAPFFTAVAVGVAAGYERGTETSSDDFEEMIVEKPIRGGTSSVEMYFRMGFAFGR